MQHTLRALNRNRAPLGNWRQFALQSMKIQQETTSEALRKNVVTAPERPKSRNSHLPGSADMNLGMSLTEWRNRLRFVTATAPIEKGRSVDCLEVRPSLRVRLCRNVQKNGHACGYVECSRPHPDGNKGFHLPAVFHRNAAFPCSILYGNAFTWTFAYNQLVGFENCPAIHL